MGEEKTTTRLAKRMAMMGMCSRREADEYILNGWVKVNGVTATLKGQPVLDSDLITMDVQAEQKQSERATFLLNKPYGYVSAQPEKDYKAAMDLILAENQWLKDPSKRKFNYKNRFGLAPAGRLDIDSIGLLVLTQDGRIAKQIIGEQSTIEKEYIVTVEGNIAENGLELLNHGLSLDGEALLPAQVWWIAEQELGFILKQGKKRQIRRMCALVGLKVVSLKRIRIGRIKLGELPSGKWRYLGDDERF